MRTTDTKSILTERECEVMELVSRGNYNKEIAGKLNCGETTIKKHLQNVFPKLKVNNRTEAALEFLRLRDKQNNIEATNQAECRK